MKNLGFIALSIFILSFLFISIFTGEKDNHQYFLDGQEFCNSKNQLFVGTKTQLDKKFTTCMGANISYTYVRDSNDGGEPYWDLSLGNLHYWFGSKAVGLDRNFFGLSEITDKQKAVDLICDLL